MELKYILLSDLSPVIFLQHLEHASMASKFRDVISAGKFNIYPACPPEVPNPQVMVTHGSVSLKIKYNESYQKRDESILRRVLEPRY